MSILLQLFIQFFRTGLFAVGGGLATLPFLYEISENFGWFSSSDIVNMIAVSESTPGALGVNMSTYGGFIADGVLGGLVATFGLITPSVIIILIVARILKKFRDNPYVEKAFYGLRPASLGLIAAAGVSVGKTTLVNIDKLMAGSIIAAISWKAIILAVAIFILQKKTKMNPAVSILIAGIVGIIFNFSA